jgi:hypothetical protein
MMTLTPRALFWLLSQTADEPDSLSRPSQQQPDPPSPALPCDSLKQHRLLRGWSQQDVSDRLYALCAADGKSGVGISCKTVSRWECGEQKPSPLYRKYLCQLYGLTADRLGLV